MSVPNGPDIEFHPQSDRDAALKFSLTVLLADHRVPHLLRLATDVSFAGAEGPPGWALEQRLAGHRDESWPEGARYRAYVEPEGYSLAYPEFFCDRPTFLRYVRAFLKSYVPKPGQHEAELSDLQAVLAQEPGV